MTAGEIALEIVRESGEGEGIGFADGKAVFVPGALAGETAVVRITREAKRTLHAEIAQLTRRSPERAEAPCPYFGACGGCSMQHMAYARTLTQKSQRVSDCLARIGGFPEGSYELAPIAGMDDPWRYRNKGTAPIGAGEIGMYRAGTRELVPIEDCLLQPEPFAQTLRATRAWLRGGGDALSLLVRTGSGGTLAALTANEAPRDAARWSDAVREAVPSLRGALLLRPKGERPAVLWGSPSVEDSSCGVTTSVSAQSFRQVNPSQAERLYDEALAFASLSGGETVVDAYCGAGILTQSLAARCKQATGIEIVRAAVDEARAAAQGRKNLRFLHGACEDLLPGLPCDVLLLDPPRKGCSPAVLRAALAASPSRIVYISCDPSTLARDAARLAQGGYRLLRAAPIDMFPWTAHVETVALLRRNDT